MLVIKQVFKNCKMLDKKFNLLVNILVLVIKKLLLKQRRNDYIYMKAIINKSDVKNKRFKV